MSNPIFIEEKYNQFVVRWIYSVNVMDIFIISTFMDSLLDWARSEFSSFYAQRMTSAGYLFFIFLENTAWLLMQIVS